MGKTAAIEQVLEKSVITGKGSSFLFEDNMSNTTASPNQWNLVHIFSIVHMFYSLRSKFSEAP